MKSNDAHNLVDSDRCGNWIDRMRRRGLGVGATGMVVSGTGKVIGATADAATSVVTGGSERDTDD